MIYKSIFENKKVLFQLSLIDLRKKYAGTFFGVIWAYVNPMIRILVYWFVFAIGIKGGESGLQYGMWLISGFVPWLYFNDAIRQAGKSYRNNAQIIKNTSFEVSLLPASRMLSLYYIHIGMIIIVLTLLTVSGFNPFTLRLLYILYLDIAMLLLTQAIVWVIAPIVGVNKDFTEFVDTVMILLFWLTPILWEIKNIPSNYQFIFKLNPMFYVIDGYRQVLFTKDIDLFNLYSVYFWIFIIVFSLFGIKLYSKMKYIIVDKL